MQSWVERESSSKSQRGTYIEREVPTFGLWLVFSHANERSSSPHSLTCSKSSVLIDWNGATLIAWLRFWWGYSYTSSISWGKSQSYWLKYNSRNSFVKVGSDVRNTVLEVSSVQVTRSLVQASLWSTTWMRGPCWVMAAELCVLIWAQSATRSSP